MIRPVGCVTTCLQRRQKEKNNNTQLAVLRQIKQDVFMIRNPGVARHERVAKKTEHGGEGSKIV